MIITVFVPSINFLVKALNDLLIYGLKDNQINIKFVHLVGKKKIKKIKALPGIDLSVETCSFPTTQLNWRNQSVSIVFFRS